MKLDRTNSPPQAQALANPQELLKFHALEKSPRAMDQLWRSLGWSSLVTSPLNTNSYKLHENVYCIFCSWKCQVLEEVLKKNQENPKWNWLVFLFPLSEDVQVHWCCPESLWARGLTFTPLGLNTKSGAQISIGRPRTLLGLDLRTQKKSVFFQINFQLFLVEQ